MEENSKIQSLSVQSNIPHQTLEEDDEQFSDELTLGNSIPSEFVEDDDHDEVIYVENAPYTFNFDPFSPFNSSFFLPCSSSSSYHHPQISNSCSSCSSESDSDFSNSIVYPNCFYGVESEEEETDQMDFITDLFDSRRVENEYVREDADDPHAVSDPFMGTGAGIRVSEGIAAHDDYDDFDLSTGHELQMGLGFASGGLRVVGIESDSDTEELDAVSAVDDGNDNAVQSHENFWDCPHFDNDERDENEEVNARVDERDGLSSVIDRIEEISISSEISSEEGDTAAGVFEWEILLAVNNLERDLEFEIDGNGEGFVYTAEFDTLIGQFVETVRALKGSPPAAKSIVDNLPLVVLKKEDVKEGDHEVCAVCKDEISVEEEVTQLPCRHHYHGACIVPWLSIRNTCPVCRFELPTDDADYERRKNRTNDELQDGLTEVQKEAAAGDGATNGTPPSFRPAVGSSVSSSSRFSTSKAERPTPNNITRSRRCSHTCASGCSSRWHSSASSPAPTSMLNPHDIAKDTNF